MFQDKNVMKLTRCPEFCTLEEKGEWVLSTRTGDGGSAADTNLRE